MFPRHKQNHLSKSKNVIMENNNPLISIVIPCFNSEKYLWDTLESCINQTYKKIEIIVVDDGSTDSSLNIAQKYAEKNNNIKVISIENNGQCFARNLGLKEAKGEYIQFLDSDDLIIPQYIEEQLIAIQTNQADLAICKPVGFNESNLDQKLNQLKKESFNQEVHYTCYDYFLNFIKSVPTSYNRILASRQKVLDVEGFETSLRAAEEGNLNLKLAIQFPFLKAVYHNQKLLLKRIEYDSLAIKARKEKKIPYALISIKKSAEYYINSSSQDQLLKEFIFDKLYFQLIYAYRSGKFDYIPPAFELWKLANVSPPKLNNLSHDLLHQYLGFWQAEKILSILRSIKRTLIPLKQKK